MESVFRNIAFLILLSVNLSVVYSRTVITESTKKPVIYASVGIINRNLGTVTDSMGNFILNIPADYINDSIRISSVGYVAKVFAVKDIKNIPDTIFLADDIIRLNDVFVKPQRIKHKTAGRKNGNGFIYIEIEGNKAAGQGLAIPMKVKKRAWIKKLGFTVLTGDRLLSRMKFRVNIYRKDNSSYNLQNIKPIYVEYDKTQLVGGLFTYDFSEELMLESGEYYIELEFLENFYGEYFIMRTVPLTGKTRFRYASQSEWQTLPFGAPVFIEYDTIE